MDHHKNRPVPDRATEAEIAPPRALTPSLDRRHFLVGAGGILALTALAGCGGGSSSTAAVGTGGDSLIPIGDVVGAVNTSQIGGTGLAARSAFRDTARVDSAGAFTTSVSRQGAQMLIVADSAGAARGLAVSLPGISPHVDAASTALTLLFMTPGILTTTPAEAAAALAALQALTAFAPLSTFLAQKLPANSLPALAKGTQLETFKSACIAEYQAGHSSKQAKVTRAPTRDANSSQIDATFSNTVDKPAEVALSNFAFRYVSLIREELTFTDTEVVPPVPPILTGTNNPSTAANLLNGVSTLSWGNIFSGSVGVKSIGSGTDKPPIDLVKNPDLVNLRYWVCGPGRATSSLRPSSSKTLAMRLLGPRSFSMLSFR